MNAIIDLWNRCWKGLATITTMIVVGGGIMLIPTYIATPASVKLMKEEIKTEFQKSMQLERDLNRVDRANESILKLKIQKRSASKEKSIQEEIQADINTEEAAKARAQERIEGRKN